MKQWSILGCSHNKGTSAEYSSNRFIERKQSVHALSAVLQYHYWPSGFLGRCQETVHYHGRQFSLNSHKTHTRFVLHFHICTVSTWIRYNIITTDRWGEKLRLSFRHVLWDTQQMDILSLIWAVRSRKKSQSKDLSERVRKISKTTTVVGCSQSVAVTH